MITQQGFFDIVLMSMLKRKLEQLGINPKIIREYLVESLEAHKMMNADLTKNLDPIAFYRNELALVQVELLVAYLSLPESGSK